ncbi:hypothetical protein ACFSX9_10620 [Flavobacterium ardleyense]|uniref:Uncharacterized protein n=1 Tax=Flavobacterium ardleyense TaxID=2038737 RepID=A0ABW5Z903_9FLAO
MKYVDLTDMIDYRPYLSYLEKIKEKLPQSAREYATKKDHWDFSSDYCPHDYWLESINFNDINDCENFSLKLQFTSGKYRLEFYYEKVINYSFEVKNFMDDFKMLGSQIVIDEITIDEHNENVIVHEIALIYGSFVIKCSNMKAEWTEII